MNSKAQKKLYKSFFLIALCFITALFFIQSPAEATSWSLLPPALAIFIAFVSGQLALSLGSAVLLGCFIDQLGKEQTVLQSSMAAVTTTAGYFQSALFNKTNLQILGFVFFVLAMVQMITVSGGFIGLVLRLKKWVVGPRSAQFVTALLGCFIFIDDYANTMIVGSTMKSLTDRYKVSREKLAFLVDATSAPIAGIALVSTWIGYEVGLFSEMAQKYNWNLDGYSVFLEALPFRFYCFFMIFFVFVNIFFGIEFGPMKAAQKSPIDDKSDDLIYLNKGPTLCAVLPILTLLILVFSLLWADGGGFSTHKNPLSFTNWRLVLTESKNGISILLISSIFSFFLSLFLNIFLARSSRTSLFIAFKASLISAGLPIMILLLAWSLKLVCDDLKTGEFVVALLSDRVSPQWLPFFVFIVSALTAFATGTSWGTMAILIPTVTPLALSLSGGEYSIFVSLCLAAILDGAIMGDHCSPISDTTIMSSISTDCELMSHVRTQLPYSLVVGLVALIFGYIPAGFSLPLIVTISMALLSMIGLFLMLQLWPSKRRAVL